jgi:titin
MTCGRHRERLIVGGLLILVALLTMTAGGTTPSAAITALSVPGEPGAPEAVAGDTRAIVAVPEPTSGGAVLSYTVTAAPGGATCTIAGWATLRVCTISALTNGVAYTFTAVATDGNVTSAASPVSNSVTPGDMLAYDRALTLTQSDNIGNIMVMDPNGAFLLVGVRSSPGRITKVRLPDMSVEATLTLNAGENDLFSGAVNSDGTVAYFGTSNTDHIVQVDVTTMTRVGRTVLEVGENRAEVLLYDSVRNVLYAAMYSDLGSVVKFSPSLVRLATVTLPATARYPASAVLAPDGRYLYVGNTKMAAEAYVARVDLDTFVDGDAISLPMGTGDGTLTSVVFGADEHLYVGTNTNPGRLLKVSTSALTREADITLPTGYEQIFHAVTASDRRQAYVSTNVPSTVSKFDLVAGGSPGYASVSSITVPGTDPMVASMVMDPFGHRIYIGSGNTPAQVVAVTVGPAPRRLPDAPPWVQATASATTADVAWQVPADAGGLTVNGYAVEQATTSAGPWTPAAGGCALATTRAVVATSCEATGLTNQGYVFRVATRTTGGQGMWASTSASVTPSGAPTSSTSTTPVAPETSVSPVVTQPTPTVTTSTPTATTAPTNTTAPSTSLAPAPDAAAAPPGLITGQTVVVDGGGWGLRAEPLGCDGGACVVGMSVDGRPTITLVQSGRIRVSGDGFQPGTNAQVWMFSEPMFLGALAVGDDGTFAGEFELVQVAVGDHTLQVHGLTPTGEKRRAELGVRVLADTVVLPSTGSNSLGRLMTLAALLVALGVGVLLARHRRRQKRPCHGQSVSILEVCGPPQR